MAHVATDARWVQLVDLQRAFEDLALEAREQRQQQSTSDQITWHAWASQHHECEGQPAATRSRHFAPRSVGGETRRICKEGMSVERASSMAFAGAAFGISVVRPRLRPSLALNPF